MIALFLTTVFVLPSNLAQGTFIKPKPDIDFESELWDFSENHYKDYILSVELVSSTLFYFSDMEKVIGCLR